MKKYSTILMLLYGFGFFICAGCDGSGFGFPWGSENCSGPEGMGDDKFVGEICKMRFACSADEAQIYQNSVETCVNHYLYRDEYSQDPYYYEGYIAKDKGNDCLSCLDTATCADVLEYQPYLRSGDIAACPVCSDIYAMQVLSKPNIYLYPETDTAVSVSLEFPSKGYVTVSDPEYGNGWNVSIKPDGTIDGEYRFLFYEADVPSFFQHSAGWRVDRGELEIFFRTDLSEVGFNDAEIEDFMEYWVERMISCDAYDIFPQTNIELDRRVILKIEPAPDLLVRYAYIASCADGPKLFPDPGPHRPVERTGFSVFEWGVIRE